MLDEFIVTNRDAIIARTRARVATRACPKPIEAELANGIPVFLDQLGTALVAARKSGAVDHEQLIQAAGRHGGDLLRMGLTVGQVVHDYGDLCQAITELAVETMAPISGAEFQTLNLCLDDAIAGAVSEFARLRERSLEAEGTERLGVLTHELRNLLHTAMLAFESIKSGRVAVGGSTGTVLGRSLTGLRELIDRALLDVRLDAGVKHFERISVADFIAEVEIGALMQAAERGVVFTLTSVEPAVTIEGDRQMLIGTVSNLLQNAFKFTRKGGNVSLTTRVTADRVMFEVEDECGGLPRGKIDELFHPFEQHSADRSGVGLGLSICLRAAKTNGGELRVRDIPGKGCVFTLDVARKPPPLAVVARAS
jgi:signal transduction histidine kinase